MKGAGGIGFFGALTILFIGLKLLGHIDWHWAFVLAPTIVPLVLFVGIIGILFIINIAIGFLNEANRQLRKRERRQAKEREQWKK